MMKSMVLKRGAAYTKAFKKLFLELLIHCKETGIKKVWLSIDGSNNDCEVKESDLSEYGYAKSHNDSKIVSFIYAVDAENGRPVSYFVNPGSVVDSKSFMEIAAALNLNSRGYLYLHTNQKNALILRHS